MELYKHYEFKILASKIYLDPNTNPNLPRQNSKTLFENKQNELENLLKNDYKLQQDTFGRFNSPQVENRFISYGLMESEK